MVELRNVSFIKENRVILDGISLSFRSNERVILTGPNGSGKTTLALIMAGIFKPSSGEVFIDNRSIHDLPLTDLRKRIGIVFQEPEMQFITMSVEREICFGLQNIDIPSQEIYQRAAKVRNLFGIEDIWNKSPYNLSGGEKQIVAIASIYAMEPSFIIFDEVTTFLDRIHRERIYEILKILSSGFLWITQDFEEIGFGERLIVLEGGKITFDGPTEPLIQSDSLDTPSSKLRKALKEAGLEDLL